MNIQEEPIDDNALIQNQDVYIDGSSGIVNNNTSPSSEVFETSGGAMLETAAVNVDDVDGDTIYNVTTNVSVETVPSDQNIVKSTGFLPLDIMQKRKAKLDPNDPMYHKTLAKIQREFWESIGDLDMTTDDDIDLIDGIQIESSEDKLLSNDTMLSLLPKTRDQSTMNDVNLTPGRDTEQPAVNALSVTARRGPIQHVDENEDDVLIENPSNALKALATKAFVNATISIAKVKAGVNVPDFYHQIAHSPQKKEWMDAMKKELNTLVDLGTFEIVTKDEIPTDAMILQAQSVFDVKLNEFGEVVRYKARYVARGDQEEREWQRLTKQFGKLTAEIVKHKPRATPFLTASLSPDGLSDTSGRMRPELFSPTAQMYLFRYMLCIFIVYMKPNGGVLMQVDGVNAFPNSPMPKSHPTVIIKTDNQFRENTPAPYNQAEYVKLCKALYGLRCASRAWFLMLRDLLLNLGFQIVGLNECMYVLRASKGGPEVLTSTNPKETATEIKLILLVYVDDIVIAAKDKTWYDWYVKKMSTIIEVKELGELTWFLGNALKWNDDHVTLSQTAYIETIMDRYNLTDIKSKSTPLLQGFVIDPENSKKWRLSNAKPNFDYRGLLGCLLYVNTCTRPDISVAVSMLARVSECFCDTDVKAIIHLCAYLNTTKEHKLTYLYHPSEIDSNIRFYADASFANAKPIPKSRTGAVGVWLGGAVWWSSKLQDFVTASTGESEYVALYVATIAALVYREVWNIIFKDTICVDIYGDNASANKLATSEEVRTMMKYLAVKLHLVRERHRMGHVCIKPVKTDQQLADILTKNLGKTKFTYFRHRLLGCLECSDQGRCNPKEEN